METIDTSGIGGSWGWLIIILLFFLAFNGNGGLFGGSSQQGETLTNLERDTLNGQKSIEESILTTSAKTQSDIAQTNYNTLLGFKDQANQLAQCCCEIKTEVITQNQMTRDLINQHYVNELAEKLSDAKAVISNQQQTQTILATLGSWYSKPSVNPYIAYNGNCNTL